MRGVYALPAAGPIRLCFSYDPTDNVLKTYGIVPAYEAIGRDRGAAECREIDAF